MKYASDFGTFTTSGKVPSSYASFSGSAGGGIAYNIPPIYIRIYARGTAKGEVLAFWDGKTYSAYSGSVTIGFEGGLNILIGKITVAIEGRVGHEWFGVWGLGSSWGLGLGFRVWGFRFRV